MALEEITLVYQRERIRFDGSNVAILECAPDGQDHQLSVITGRIVVKCECEPEELTAGLTYRFYGRWQTHEKYGRQFFARTVSHLVGYINHQELARRETSSDVWKVESRQCPRNRSRNQARIVIAVHHNRTIRDKRLYQRNFANGFFKSRRVK